MEASAECRVEATFFKGAVSAERAAWNDTLRTLRIRVDEALALVRCPRCGRSSRGPASAGRIGFAVTGLTLAAAWLASWAALMGMFAHGHPMPPAVYPFLATVALATTSGLVLQALYKTGRFLRAEARVHLEAGLPPGTPTEPPYPFADAERTPFAERVALELAQPQLTPAPTDFVCASCAQRVPAENEFCPNCLARVRG